MPVEKFSVDEIIVDEFSVDEFIVDDFGGQMCHSILQIGFWNDNDEKYIFLNLYRFSINIF